MSFKEGGLFKFSSIYTPKPHQMSPQERRKGIHLYFSLPVLLFKKGNQKYLTLACESIMKQLRLNIKSKRHATHYGQ